MTERPDSSPTPDWGTPAQPFWRPGANPTADLCIFRTSETGERLLLLIRRSSVDGTTEAGKWAIPGGFVDSSAPRGVEWDKGETEEPIEAAIREAIEETGVSVSRPDMVFVGMFEGGGRDPRDNPSAWSRSFAFAVDIGDRHVVPVAASDAEDYGWFPAHNLPTPMAFDHGHIVGQAIPLISNDPRRGQNPKP